ncbi:MAG TPA: SurA N-terminal domain-containing protein [Rhodanobacteraceae bacterium]|nr:SurA N-terminal domain-containing protein [Rhodanobacteraceae bacterium]
MLQQIREKLGGWPAKIIFGLMVFVFSFFGIESYFVARNETWVAKVDGHEISQQDFQNSFNQYRQQQMAQPGNTMDAADFQKPEVKRAALDRLINQQLLLNLNEKLGVVVPDSAVRAQIEQVPQFQVDGRFSPDAYLAMLSANRQTPQQYEEQVRGSLAVSRLPEPIINTAFATDADVGTYLKLRMQTRDFHYVELPEPRPADADVTDDDVAAWYKSHLKEFMTPEQVSVQYIELNAADMKIAAATDEASLKARYEKEKARFGAPEQREAAHILISVPANATPAQQKAALAKAQEVDRQARAPNADFAQLAKQYSDDLGSKNQGGDLGWLSKGDTDPAFENALFAMKKGEISAPVLSPEGYHIIDLKDVRGGQVRTFAQVRDQLAAEVEKSERENQYSDVAGKLTDLVYQDPSSLAPAAKSLGLTVQTTPLFPRSGASSGLAANKAVVKAAFSDQVLAQGNSSDPIELGSDHMVVIHVADHEPAKPKPLDQVRDTVRADILQARAEEAAKKQADALYAQLRKSGDLEAVAKAAGQSVKPATGVSRESGAFDPQLLEAVFRMPRPAKGKASQVLAPLPKGRYALVMLNEVHDGDASGLPKPQREMLRAQMGQVIGAQAIDGLLAALRAQAKIEVATDRLQ